MQRPPWRRWQVLQRNHQREQHRVRPCERRGRRVREAGWYLLCFVTIDCSVAPITLGAPIRVGSRVSVASDGVNICAFRAPFSEHFGSPQVADGL